MERWTQKDKSYFDLYKDEITEELLNEIYCKLSKLENIEEKLNISLDFFFRCLFAKTIFYIEYGRINEPIVRAIDEKGLEVFDKGFSWGDCDYHAYFENYGKKEEGGWALTREELE